MTTGALLVLLLSQHLLCQETLLPLDTYVAVASSVWRHHHACGIFLMHTSGHDAQLELLKRLSVIPIPTVAMDAGNIGDLELCPNNRPLFLVLPGDLRPLSQVPVRLSLLRPRWLVFLDASPVEDVLMELDVPFDCEVVVATLQDTAVLLREVYRCGPGMPLVVRVWGSWTADGGFLGPKDGIGTRSDLQGATLRAVVKEYDPLLLLNTTPNHLSITGGYFGHIWKIIEHGLNFTTELVEPDDDTWGSPDATGRWSGPVGVVQRGEAHVALSGYGITQDRAQVIEFSQPVVSTTAYVFMRLPNVMNSGWTSVFKPFSPSLWLAVCCANVAVAAGFTAMYTLGRWTGRVADQDGRFLLGISDIIHSTLGIFCSQGSHYERPRMRSSKLLYYFAHLTAMVLCTAYSSYLVAFLSVKIYKLPFSSFKGMLKDGRYTLGALESSTFLQVFQNAKDPTLKGVYHTLIGPEADLPKTQLEGLKWICERSLYTYFIDLRYLLLHVRTLPCRVTRLVHTDVSFDIALMFPKRSPYSAAVNRMLTRLRQRGVMNVLQAHAWPGKEEIHADIEPTSVHIGSLGGVFMMLAIGSVSAVSCLVLECSLGRNRQVRRRLAPCVACVPVQPSSPTPVPYASSRHPSCLMEQRGNHCV